MKVLVACETSGIVRRAFAARGHEAWSVDLLPAVDGSNQHIIGDARTVLHWGWDLLFVAHPPCTRLCNSGVRWLTEPPDKLNAAHYPLQTVLAYRSWDRARRLAFMWDELAKAADLFSAFWNAPIRQKCLENPIMHGHAKKLIVNYPPRRQIQIVQPWWFGEPQFKATALHLQNLIPLHPTNKLIPPKPGTEEHKQWSKVHRASPGIDRWRERSIFFPGIAEAMADRWGGELVLY